MALRINTLQINSETERQSIIDNSDKKLVKGISVSINSDLSTMNTAYKALKTEGTVANLNNNTTENEFAIALLSSFNCSISSETKDFTLLSAQTDTEEIENENIIDEKLFKDLTGKKTSATDKFSNTDNDPFYTLDDLLEKTISAEVKSSSVIKETNLQNLVSEMVKENLSSSGTTIKQFSK